MVIDCDAHVEESAGTWSYLEPEFYKFRPIPVLFPEDTCFGSHNAAWVIDYKLRFFGSNPTISRMLEGVPRPYTDDFPQIHPLGSGLVSLPYVLYAFQQILSSDLLDAFPDLRVGFMEAGSEWVPRLVKTVAGRKGAKVEGGLGERVFVSCGMSDDLPYLISRLGDDWHVTATDYPHGDAFREDHLAAGLRRCGNISDATVTKILETNPARLFHLA